LCIKSISCLAGLFLIIILGVACNQMMIAPKGLSQDRNQEIEQSGDVNMQVELDIFSGRPNPQWTLASEENEEFFRQFQALPESTAGKLEIPGLGYRGFRVTAVEDMVEGCSEILVFRENVVATCDGKSRHFTDRDQILEQWLVQTSKGHVEDDIYQLIVSEVEVN